MKLFESAQKSKRKLICTPFTARSLAIALVSCLALPVASHLLVPAVLGQCPHPVPLFQFQVFYYQDDLEIEPSAPMTITGTVAANSNIYLAPEDSLTFQSTVATSREIYLTPNPPYPIVFEGPLVSNVFPYILPGDTYVTNGGALLQVPLPGQTPNSAEGQYLLYNQADMIVMVSSNNSITVTSGAGIDGQATVVSSEQWQVFLNTNGVFVDQRDELTVNPVVINVSNLVNWSATNRVLRPVLANARGSGEADVQSIYVADLRNCTNEVPDGTSNIITTNIIDIFNTVTNYTTNTTLTSVSATNKAPPLPPLYSPDPLPPYAPYVVVSNKMPGEVIITYSYYLVNEVVTEITNYCTNYTTNAFTNHAAVLTSQPGIVLSNGAVLPPQGLSIITPDPAYIAGNWNVKNSTNAGAPSDAGSSNTTGSLPSAIFADAITVLSPAWNPANSALDLADRIAANDTVNAAFYAGNVPTANGNYSGGLENFPRLLENWEGQTFTWNGSMCCMFESRIANAPWPGTGSVYEPPVRNWAFDINYSDPVKEPPLTPLVEMPAPVCIQSVAETSGAISLSWNSWPGVKYTMQYTTNLSGNNWQTLDSFIALSTVSSLSDPATNKQRFYRLQASP